MNLLSLQLNSRPIAQSTSSLTTLTNWSYFLFHRVATPPRILPRLILVLRSVVDSPASWKSLCTELRPQGSCLNRNVSCTHNMSQLSSSLSTTIRRDLCASLWPTRSPRALYDTTQSFMKKIKVHSLLATQSGQGIGITIEAFQFTS